MLFRNFKIGQKVWISDVGITALVLGTDPVYEKVLVKTLQDHVCPYTGKFIEAGFEENVPELLIKPYVLN